MEFSKHTNQRTNVQQIFQQIMEKGPISRRELQEITGFSWGLISQVTNRLIADGYLAAECASFSAGVGRRAEKLDIVDNDHFYIGVDINSDGMYAVVSDMKGRCVESQHYVWPKRTYDQVIQTLYVVLDGLMDKYADKNITGIGVSVQGIANVVQGVSAYIRKINGWVNVPLREMLVRRYDLDVVVAHDPDCMMESEYAFGILRNTNAKNVLLVHYNRDTCSLGMSAMVEGQIYFGHRGRAAEIGYTIVGEKADGSPRMLEDILLDSQVSQEELFANIGKAVAIANTMYNPQIIVLNISEGEEKNRVIETVERWLRTASYDETVQVLWSQLESDANARGAAMIMINRTVDGMM